MAGRSEARLFISVWKNDEYRALSFTAQWLFEALISQPEMTHCGVIPLRPSRWAKLAKGLTTTAVEAAAEELIHSRFVVADDETGELLVRSLMRRDKVLRQPFLIEPVTVAVGNIESVRIASVVLAEMTRIRDEGDVNERITGHVNRLISDLECRLDTDLGVPSDSHPDRHPETHPRSHPETDPDSHPDRHPETHSEGHPRRDTGGRGNYCSSEELPLSPDPPPPPPDAGVGEHATGPPDPADATTEGEGDQDQDKIAADLAADVRLIRPDWSTKSIVRALADPAVAERPAHMVAVAVLALARDPESKHPGRLAHDGPWWHQRPPSRASPDAPRSMPPWCGKCDEIDRTIEHPGGVNGQLERCPNCHPATQNGSQDMSQLAPEEAR